MAPPSRVESERRISAHLSVLARELGAAGVLGYVALRDEVRIDSFLAASVEGGLVVGLPRAEGGELRFARWAPCAQLTRDAEGVPAPVHPEIEISGADRWLLLVPGRAFDREGRRLGRGGGYYDRALARRRPGMVVAGVAYSCQVVDEVPAEERDAPVDWLVTETSATRTVAIGEIAGDAPATHKDR